MRIEKTKVNQVIFNKATREYLLVTEMNDGIAIAHPFPDDTEMTIDAIKKQLDWSRKFEINADTAICNQFITDLNAPEVPRITDYTVENGVLLKNKVPVCNQGEIKIMRIIETLLETVIVLGRYQSEMYIYAYNCAGDRFYRLYSLKEFTPEIKTIRKNDGEAILSVWDAKTVEMICDGQAVQRTVINKSALLVVRPKGCNCLDLMGMVPEAEDEDVIDVNNNDIAVVVRKTAENAVSDDGTMYTVLTDDPGDALIYYWNKNESKPHKIEEGLKNDVCLLRNGYYTNIVYVSKDIVKIPNSNKAFVPTPEIIEKITDKYPVLIDILSVYNDDATTLWIFSNTMGTDVFTVSIKKTRDRGVIINAF